jgi:hypothetical protein
MWRAGMAGRSRVAMEIDVHDCIRMRERRVQQVYEMTWQV